VTDGPRTALVHDFLVDVRGAERVFEVLCATYPDADVFAGIYDGRGTEGRFADRGVTATWLQHLRPNARTFRVLLPLYPRAIEALDLHAYDLVISSSSAWAHGVRVRPDAVHVSYCHNPFRYAWDERDAVLAARDPLTRAVLAPVLERWRAWDRQVAMRVDRYVANSLATRKRIRRCFDREADLVYPPVATARFTPGPVGEHYVVVSELMRHKRIDVAIEGFNRLKRPLVVIGDGPDARRLRSLAGPTISFAGRVSDAEVAAVLASTQALVVPGAEEFGIAAVEAQAAGRPVVGLRAGGLRETLVEGVTGAFFETSTSEALADAVSRFDPLAVDPEDCVRNAARFEPRRFADGIRASVAGAVAGKQRAPRLAADPGAATLEEQLS
jgi:glycosyltransferase involved in cell wall biosynthesis